MGQRVLGAEGVWSLVPGVRECQLRWLALVIIRPLLDWLLLGSGVVLGRSRHQGGEEGSEQGFAAAPGVVHELEEAEVERQLVLRDAPVRPQPGAQHRPEAFHGVDVDLAVAVAVLVPGVFARPWRTLLWR